MIVQDGFGDQAWFDAWYSAFAPGVTRYPLAFSGADFQPELIAGNVSVLRRPWRFLRAPVNVHSPTYGWKLSRPPDVTELSRCLRDVVRAARCHGIEIGLVPCGSPTLGLLRDLASTRSWVVSIQESEQLPIVDVDGRWDDYWRALPSKLRKNLNAQERQLNQLGCVKFQDAAQLANWRDWFEKALALEAAGWKGQAGSAILQRPNEARFYRDVAQAAADKRRLRLFILTLADRVVACHLMISESNVLFWLKTAYDEALAHYSPGLILLHLSLKECSSDPSVMAVNIPGGPAWTLRWPTRTETLMRVRAVPACSAAGLCLGAEMGAKRFRAWLRNTRRRA